MCWLCVAEDENAAREICVDCGVRCAGGCVDGEIDLLCHKHRRECSDCEVVLCSSCVGKCGGCEADECGACLSSKGGSLLYCKDCL